ncbi:uncharacterized protein TNCV_901981 [Trichonephila clavipes]|nr:uncharacterized protein TNCV_901981 [Trichonephila clavipes]
METQRFVQFLHFSSFLRLVVDVTWPWDILKSDETHFAWMAKFTPTIVEFGQRKILTLSRKKPYILKKETIWCDFTTTFLIGYFFEEIKPNGIPTCSITGELYHDMLRDFVTPEFQQRGYNFHAGWRSSTH